MDRFRKWIDKDRYDEVMKRQMRYWRESGGNLVNKYGSLDKCIGHLEEKERENARKRLETVDKLKKMYDLYSLYGYKYMSVKYPGFHTSAFLEKCGRYGVIDYRPSKDTAKKNILYKGEVHGINEWCDILGIRCRSSVYRIHSMLGVEYEEIFRRYELDGGFGGFDMVSSRKDDVSRREDSLRRELLGISKYGSDCGYDYVQICDMHLSGMSVEDIREEVVRMSGRRV